MGDHDAERLRELTARLAESEGASRALLDAVPTPVFGYDPDSLRIGLVNAAAAQEYGYTREELLSMTVADLRPASEVARLKAELARPVPVRVGVWKHRRKDGSLLDVDVVTHEAMLGGRKLRISTATDVTDQLALARKLAEQHVRLRAILSGAPVVIFAIDEQGKFSLSEGQGLAAAGLKPGQVVGMPALAVYGATPFTAADGKEENGAQVLARVLAGEEYSGLSFVGQTVYANRFHPQRDESGRVVGMIGIATDITGIRRAEDRASERERRYRELFEHTSDGVFILDVLEDGRFRLADFNPAEERLIGFTAASRGKLVAELLPPELAQSLEANYRRCIEAAEPITYTEELPLPSGGRSFATTLVPLRDGRGVCRRIIGVARNVTEQVQSERALRESERRFRALIQNSSDGTMVVSPEGEILFRSASLVRILGYAEGEALGHMGEYVHPEDLARFQAGWAEMLSKPGVPVMLSGRVRHHDGSYRTLEGVSTNQLSDPGLGGVVVNFRDVSERVQLQAQLMAADRMASLGTLAAGVAHEINNPLAYLIANLALCAELFEEPKAREAVLAAQEAAERVRKIVRGLKAFTRADEITLGPVDVSQVADATANLALNEIQHHGRLERDYAQGLPRALANDSRLGQVLLNLLVNASHALQGAAGPDKVITLRTRLHEGRVVIDVQDTGIGIPREQLARIFEPFFTTKPIGVGTGLGLYICNQLAASMNATLSVASEPGRGSTFRVSLPQAQGAAPAAAAAPPAAPHAGEPRARLLAVDDEPNLATVLQRTLRAHDVTIAASAAEALALIRGGQAFDLILCDLMMPGMTGMELHETLVRERPDLARRMIFLTGGAFTPRAREFLDTVDAPRVEKPFEVRALRELVAEQLRLLGAGSESPVSATLPSSEQGSETPESG